MKYSSAAIGIVFSFVCCAGAVGELQDVQVGGSVLVLGEYYRNVLTPGDGLRWTGTQLYARPTGDIYTWVGADRQGPGWHLVSQWTRLNVRSNFTERVSAFIEFDSVETWGEDFRSLYATGQDLRANTVDDLEVYQSYVNVEEMFGLPVRLRLGRQELSFGSEWLVGNNDVGPAPFYGLSFDGVRVTYAGDLFSVDAWSTKLIESSPIEEDGDADFHGIYTSYLGVENVTFDAYWLWLRDGLAVKDYDRSLLGEWVEDLVGADDYDPYSVHTVGLRAAGDVGAFDFEAEAAYQFGDASQVGGLFVSTNYGDDDAKYDAWAANLEAGYTFDMPWSPRVYLGYAYFSGEDKRDIDFAQWLESFANPFYRPRASVSFNRLFSDKYYSSILDGTEMSNVHVFRGGACGSPTEKVGLGLDVVCLRADEAFKVPPHIDLGHVLGNYRLRVPYAADFSFWSKDNDKDLGWETTLWANYQYSEALYFGVGWSHFFTGSGLSQGNFLGSNGLDFWGGSDDADMDYVYFETGVEF